MKKLNFLLILFMVFFSAKTFAQDMMPPPPVSSPIFNSMVGTWASAPYEMMGSKITDEVTVSMVLNGQFMEADVKSASDNGNVYEGKGFFAPKSDGTYTGWFYDIYGLNNITTYTGTSEPGKLYLTGTSNMGSETRNISVEGNVMIHNVIFKWKDKDGNDLPQQSFSITYNKK